jgi:carboxylesterase
MGYPGELQYPAERLAEAGFRVHIPRLPGHGSCGEDFNRTTGRMWLRAAADAYLELSAAHREVYIMGHSMGGIIASLLASRFPVPRMVLMAPALKLQGPLGMTEIIHPFVNKKLKKPLWEHDPAYTFRDDRDEDDDLYMGQEYWTWAYFSRMADLSRLRKRAVSRLHHVSADVLTIMGGRDETVAPDAASLVAARVKGRCETVVLPDSAHLVPYDKEYEKNAELAVTWFAS